jgi:hypothetical protein
MAFQAECVFCGYQVQVPDRALGASGRCPKCSSFFTLAPLSEPRAPGPPGRWRAENDRWRGVKGSD